MLSLKSPISLASLPQANRLSCPRRIVSCKAASMGSMDEFTNESISSAAMGLLSRRIESLKRELAAGHNFDKMMERRPQLPTGVQRMMWEEMKFDHELLCSWHEAAWRAQQQQQTEDGPEA